MFVFKNISKRFTSDWILNDFHFTIDKGDKVNILGKSGIGKTTLFRLMLGFEQPDKGEIYFEGNLLDEKNVWDVRKKIAYVSQDLNIGLGTVQQLFDDTLSLKANVNQKDNLGEKIKECLDLMEFPNEILKKNIEELSGGEKQRVAIINAILLGRQVYLLDEITSSLDKKLKVKVMNYFLTDPELTVLFISHDQYATENVQVKSISLV